jgi:hypothetical protein
VFGERNGSLVISRIWANHVLQISLLETALNFEFAAEDKISRSFTFYSTGARRG